jgi:hypothetical protein
MQTVDLYKSGIHSESCVFILVSILVLANTFIAFMAFSPHYSPDEIDLPAPIQNVVFPQFSCRFQYFIGLIFLNTDKSTKCNSTPL